MRTFRQILFAFLRQFAFWMVFFALTRIVFLLFHTHLLAGIDAVSILAVFWHALRLDVSTACYIMAFPFLLTLIQSFWSPKWINVVHLVYTLLILFAFSGIVSAEIGVYEDWHTKMHFKALLIAENPSEVFNTAGPWRFIGLLLTWLLMTAAGFFLWLKVFFVKLISIKRHFLAGLVFLVCGVPLLGLGIRGGFQQIPINQSDAYFSKQEILNLTAVNSGWNMLHSIVQNYKAMGKNPFVFFEDEKAKAWVREICYVPCDSTTAILTTQRPNIVFFVLEGWAADVLAAGGGDPRTAPFMNSLDSASLIFTRVHSSGTRSQQGMAAIFSGYPSFPYSTITQHPEKYSKIPSMIKMLDSAGYSSSYYFGGQLIYGNLKSYIMQDFNRVVEEADIDAGIPRGKLGVHDAYLLPIMLKDLNQEKEPFVSAIFTMSTHTPYDYGTYETLTGFEAEQDYMNAVHYADHCLQTFFEEARTQPWYKNTLFVFISDHSHGTNMKRDMFCPEYYRIVCRLYGDVIKPEYRGVQISRIASQTDLPATLMPQMGFSSAPFVWSKNLMNPFSPEYAYYSFEVGLGWVRPCGYYVREFRVEWDYYLQADSLCPYSTARLKEEGNAYLQVLYQDFLDK